MGKSYQHISIIRTGGKLFVQVVRCQDADKGTEEETLQKIEIKETKIYLRITVLHDAVCSFSYSIDGVKFSVMGENFKAVPGMWISARIGFFARCEGFINDSGSADIDWFRINKNE